MVDEAEPPDGLDAHWAFLKYTDPEKLEAWDVATKAIPPDPRFERFGFLRANHVQGEGWESLGPLLGKRRRRRPSRAKLKTYLNAKRDAATAQRAACSDFIDRPRRGEIVAFGSPDTEGATERSQIDAVLWDKLRARTASAWHGSQFSGGGHVYHDVMFHRVEDLDAWPGRARFWATAFKLEEWWGGISLCDWVLERAPEIIEAARHASLSLALGVNKEFFTDSKAEAVEREIFRDIKRELDSLLRSGLDANHYVLGILPTKATEGIGPVHPDNLDVVIESIHWWPDHLSAQFNDGPVRLRLYLPDRFEATDAVEPASSNEARTEASAPAPTPNIGRTLPSEGKLYGLVWYEVDKIDDPLKHFAKWGNKAAFARKLEGQEPFSVRPYKASSITRELTLVLGGLKQDS